MDLISATVFLARLNGGGGGGGAPGAELTIIEQEMRHREREETYRTHIQSAKVKSLLFYLYQS